MNVTIMFTNKKGGVGKTTLATNVAAELSRRYKTLLIDADDQCSAVDFGAARMNTLGDDNLLQVISKNYTPMKPDAIRRDVRMLKEDYEFIVIDTPPESNQMTQSLMVVSDLVLIPVNPSYYDVWAMVQIQNDVLKVIAATEDRLQARIVLNQRDDRQKLSGEAKEAIAQLEIPVAKTTIGQRAAWRKCKEGLSVIEKKQQMARLELEHLVDEILEICKEREIAYAAN